MYVKIEGFESILVTSCVAFVPSAIAQVTDITTVADVNGSLAEKFFYMFSKNNDILYAFQMNMYREVTSITTVGDTAGSLNSTYFLMKEPDGTGHYFWFNVSAGGSDPAPSVPAGYTNGHVVAITTGDADTVVAGLLNTVINGVTGFDSTVASAIITVTNSADGDATDALDGTGTPNQPTLFTIATTQSGSVNPYDIVAENATIVQVPFVQNDIADDIAIALDLAIDAQVDFGTSTTANVITVTNAAAGKSSRPRDTGTGFTFAETTAGKGTFTSPPTLYKIIGKTFIPPSQSQPQHEQYLNMRNISIIVPVESIYFFEE